MRVPLSWLREFNDCTLPPEELARRLTLGGLEVEAIERIGVFSEDARVGEVIESRDHPRAENLRVVEVSLGADRTATAITGAPNVPAGLPAGTKLAVALPGAVLIDPKAETFALTTVAARPVMGIESEAVLCSPKELGLSDDHSGVLVLGEGAADGERIIEHESPSGDAEADIVFDVAILPNYGRCLSIIGMAREIAALTRTSFELALDAAYLPTEEDAFDIRIADPDLCARYSGYVLEGVTVKPSPRWMQRRLVLAGHKPINNLVDVTNYVMTEMGQPMHAFDVARLPARNIEVRRARPGETIYTLDQKLEDAAGAAAAAGGPERTGDDAPRGSPGGNGAQTAKDGGSVGPAEVTGPAELGGPSELEGPGPSEKPGAAPRELDDSTLLITSGGKPVAVAGVIGGLESQIYPDTKNVLLESANFDATAIRKATARLKVSTESSYRFSRDVDPSLTTLAIHRAVKLLETCAGASPRGAISDRYPRPRRKRTVRAKLSEIRRSLGMELDPEEVRGTLERLGFEVREEGEGTIAVDVPGFRTDVEIPADIAEEVIRVIGFDRLEPRRLAEPLPRQRRSRTWEIKRRVRDLLVGAGLQDVITYSLTTPESEARLWRGRGEAEGDDRDKDREKEKEKDEPPYVRVLNPSSLERVAMRRTLLGGLLETVERNHRHRDRIALFEIGLVWHPESGEGPLPAEVLRLAIVLSGPIEEPSWLDGSPRRASFFDLKGMIEGMAEHLRVEDATFNAVKEAPYHPGISAEVRIGGRRAGALGRIHPEVAERYDLEGREVIACELDLAPWIEAWSSRYVFRKFSRFPAVREDLNLVVSEDVAAERVRDAVRDAAGPLLTGIHLLDLYRGEQIDAGKKSLNFRLTYSAEDRSLSQEEVNALRDAMLRVLEKEIGARIR